MRDLINNENKINTYSQLYTILRCINGKKKNYLVESKRALVQYKYFKLKVGESTSSEKEFSTNL